MMSGVGWDEHVVPLMVRAPFDPAKHPRVPKGRHGGGEWAHATSAVEGTHGVASQEDLDAAVVSSTGPEQAAKAARAYTRAATMALGDILGTGQWGWNGKVNPKTRAEFGDVLGANEWDGSISYRDDVLAGLGLAKAHPHADVDPQPFYVLAHESIHSEGERHIPHPFEVGGIRYDWTESEVAYQHPGNAHLEEGFTELGTLQHAPELFDRMGVADRLTPFMAPGDTDAYWYSRSSLGTALEHAYSVAGGKPDLRAALEHAQMALGGGDSKPAKAIAGKLRALHSGDADWLADNIDASAREFDAAPKPRQMTLKEYAEHIAGQDIGWGHYPEFQAAALGWLYDVAYAEGSTAKGPLARRIVALADEVNRVGTDQKTAVMARQLFRAAKLDGTEEDAANLGAQIANEFAHADQVGFDGGKVFRRLTAEWAAKLKHPAVTR